MLLNIGTALIADKDTLWLLAVVYNLVEERGCFFRGAFLLMIVFREERFRSVRR